MKLKPDDQEILDLLLSDSLYWSVIMKTIEAAVGQQRDAFVGTSVSSQEDILKLAMERKRYEGALNVQLYMESLKRKKEKKSANR